MDYFRLFLAILPLLFFSVFLLFSRSISLLKISIATFIITVLIVFVFWHLSFSNIAINSGNGLFIALDIFFIIFGAILFLETLKGNKIIDSLTFHLDHFSPDFRIQVIILAWLFENFLEGIAGFGTPSTVVAPLLIAMGISPLKAVVISLLGNSFSVPFGAVGTPIRVGFANINLDFVSIGQTTAIYNFVGILVPVFMLGVLVHSSKNRLTLFKQALPFALWSGIAFVVPAFIISLFGIEFPSIIGSVIGVILIAITNKIGLFTPKQIYYSPSKIKFANPLSFQKTIIPYFIFIFLLTVGKIFFSNSSKLFNPGFIFVITTFIFAFWFKIDFKNIFSTCKIALKKSIEPFLVTAAISAVVQLMNNSSNPAYNLPSITEVISTSLNTSALPLMAPFIGALGSFITGSATVSNLMFGSSIYLSSLFLQMNPIKNLSLALAGAGAGNMIAISDVLVAKTVADCKSSLRKIIFSLLPFCVVCLILISLLGIFY